MFLRCFFNGSKTSPTILKHTKHIQNTYKNQVFEHLNNWFSFYIKSQKSNLQFWGKSQKYIWYFGFFIFLHFWMFGLFIFSIVWGHTHWVIISRFRDPKSSQIRSKISSVSARDGDEFSGISLLLYILRCRHRRDTARLWSASGIP